MLHIPLQLVLLTVSSMGWGYWLYRLTGSSGSRLRLPELTLHFASGFVLQVLLLQNLVYLGAPVRTTFWIPLLLGAFGFVRLVPIARKLGLPRGTKTALVLLAVVSLVQSATAIHAGRQNYYGKGHIDQINYVFLSEFVRTESFHTPLEDGSRAPWLLKGLYAKEKRIGQSVAAAYVASASGVDAKDSYAACVSFGLALLAVLVFALGRALSLPYLLAMVAAAWAALSPAMTRIALEGFFSQVETVFVYCYLLVWAASAVRLSAAHLTLPAIALAFQFVTYTESFLVSVVLFAFLVTYLMFRLGKGAVLAGVISLAVSLLLVPMYLFYALRFITEQYSVAANAATTLENLAADAGTLIGWSRGLVAFPLVPASLAYSLGVLAAIAMIALAASSLMTMSLRRRALLAFAAAAPWLVLVYLLASPVFARYPFWKLIDSFSFLWIVLVLLGLTRSALVFRWAPRRHALRSATVAGAIFAVSAAAGCVSQHRAAMLHPGVLAILNSQGFQSAIDFVSQHPERTYLIHEPDGGVAAWLAFHARQSKTYAPVPALGDIPVAGHKYEFDRSVPIAGTTTLLGRFGARDESATQSEIDVIVTNPQGEDRPPTGPAYWLGDTLSLDLARWAPKAAAAEYRLTFRAEPGPANPARDREMALVNLATGARNQIRIAAAETVSVPVVLVHGLNRFRLQSISPTEHLVKIGADPRKHLTFVSGFTLAPTSVAISADDPRLSVAPSTAPPPELRFQNRQRADQQGALSWFWVADEMTIEIARADDSPRTRHFTLSFDAEAGPANPSKSRKLRIAGKTFEINGSGRINAEIPAPPGVSQWKLQLIDAPPQTNWIPGDPRNHMLRVERFDIAFLREAGAPVPLAPRQKAATAR